jgi:hypothetical protein
MNQDEFDVLSSLVKHPGWTVFKDVYLQDEINNGLVKFRKCATRLDVKAQNRYLEGIEYAKDMLEMSLVEHLK